MKQIILIFLAFFSFFYINATPTSTGEIVLTVKEQENCAQFKALQGTDRVNAFEAIAYLFKTEDRIANSNLDIVRAVLSEKSTIINLLGVPDAEYKGGYIQYNLKSSNSSCHVIIAFNTKNEIVFYAIKNCN